MPLSSFYPTQYCESVLTIDYAKLYQLGYRGLIFDIDQTLVNHGDPATAEVEELFRQIQTLGFKTLLLSNNSQERIEAFTTNIDTAFIPLANKPQPQGFQAALKQLGLPKDQVLMIGDQVFTDILGANRVGLKSILVRFIRRHHETKIGKKRQLERLILATYGLSKKHYNQLGAIERKGD